MRKADINRNTMTQLTMPLDQAIETVNRYFSKNAHPSWAFMGEIMKRILSEYVVFSEKHPDAKYFEMSISEDEADKVDDNIRGSFYILKYFLAVFDINVASSGFRVIGDCNVHFYLS